MGLRSGVARKVTEIKIKSIHQKFLNRQGHSVPMLTSIRTHFKKTQSWRISTEEGRKEQRLQAEQWLIVMISCLQFSSRTITGLTEWKLQKQTPTRVCSWPWCTRPQDVGAAILQQFRKWREKIRWKIQGSVFGTNTSISAKEVWEPWITVFLLLPRCLILASQRLEYLMNGLTFYGCRCITLLY